MDNSKSEAKKVIKKAGTVLDDDMFKQVSGGVAESKLKIYCQCGLGSRPDVNGLCGRCKRKVKPS